MPTKTKNVLLTITTFTLILPIGFVADQILVKTLGRPYFSLPRLEFFLLIWPCLAIIIGITLKKSKLAAIAKGIFWHGAILLSGSLIYFVIILMAMSK